LIFACVARYRVAFKQGKGPIIHTRQKAYRLLIYAYIELDEARE
jgi:hypothetical protein